jgi:transposase
MADHVGACTAALMPLYELIKAHVFAAERLHGDDTTVPVLAKVKCRTGRLWTDLRDDQPFGGVDPPSAVFFYSPDHIHSYSPKLMSAIVGVETVDHPSDAQLVAYARKYFKATDRMQPQKP